MSHANSGFSMCTMEEIKEKLKLIQSRGWRSYRPVGLGIDRHKFEFNPPLPEQEIVIFEKYLDVELPEDYKKFLTEIGNGGAGPFYGILPLEKWAEAVNGLPKEEFSLEAPDTGSITICEQGCTYYTLLILNGQDKGCPCNYDMQSRECHLSQYKSFSSWYIAWLDLVLANKEIKWFGYEIQ